MKSLGPRDSENRAPIMHHNDCKETICPTCNSDMSYLNRYLCSATGSIGEYSIIDDYLKWLEESKKLTTKNSLGWLLPVCYDMENICEYCTNQILSKQASGDFCIAPDGKMYHTVTSEVLRPLEPDEVELIEYVRPKGKRWKLVAKPGEEIAKKARELIIACEFVSSTNDVFFFVRRKGELCSMEATYIRQNTSDPDEGNKILSEIVEDFYDG